MSMLGAGAKSLRAPATPSMTGRPWTGSNAPGWFTGPATGVNRDQFEPPFVFGGDVLFAGSVGRTDLGGDGPRLLSGIRAKLFNLPDATLVLPGHGPITTVAAEKRSNPFVGEGAGLYGIGPG